LLDTVFPGRMPKLHISRADSLAGYFHKII
jgi:hypothetical protein